MIPAVDSGTAQAAGPPQARLRRGRARINVVVFSGGRGSTVLSTRLIANPQIALTMAINGYDDGASTGEVRRFLGDSLGPSDFRKNASRVAQALSSCSGALIELMDIRLPVGTSPEEASATFDALAPGRASDSRVSPAVRTLAGRLSGSERRAVSDRLEAFRAEFDRAGRPFDFSDCSLGNLVFAGSFLAQGRVFNAAIDDYCAMMGLPVGVIENVTDGTNAWLVALDDAGGLLATEEEIVRAGRPTRIRDIYLVDRPFTERDRAACLAVPPDDRNAWLERRAPVLPPNPRLMEKIADADLIIYAPGTQHSSLFPSYLTAGISDAIARQTSAVKLLITNIQADAEIPDASAVDIIERALYYMKERGRRALLTPSLITHYLVNDPVHPEVEQQPYVPLGSLDRIEDPRLVRIGDFEDGISGRHDASKVLAPFVSSLLGPDREPRIAVYLHDAGSLDKLAQTLLEMVRGGVESLPVPLTVVHAGPALDAGFVSTLPLTVVALPAADVLPQLARGGFDYTILFESSGMYRGEDVVGLASQVLFLRLDAVWGSRRLSPRDVDEAYKLVYRHHWLLGIASRVGSHVLSALYLLLYGRYITDSLSGARALRSRYLQEIDVEPGQKLANHQLLSALLRDRAEILETPIRFFPMSPERVRRTSLLDGWRAVWTILRRRFGTRPAVSAAGSAPGEQA